VSADALDVWIRVLVALPLGLAVGSFSRWSSIACRRGVRSPIRVPVSLVRCGDREPGQRAGRVVALLGAVPRLRGEDLPVYPLTEPRPAPCSRDRSDVRDVWVAVMLCAFLARAGDHSDDAAIASSQQAHLPPLIGSRLHLLAWLLGSTWGDPIRAAIGFAPTGRPCSWWRWCPAGWVGSETRRRDRGWCWARSASGTWACGRRASAGASAPIARSRALEEDAIPFGPYMAIGAMIAVFFGERLASAYLGSS